MLRIRPAIGDDAATILDLIRALAIYEREPDAVTATDAEISLRDRRMGWPGSGLRLLVLQLFDLARAAWSLSRRSFREARVSRQRDRQSFVAASGESRER